MKRIKVKIKDGKYITLVKRRWFSPYLELCKPEYAYFGIPKEFETLDDAVKAGENYFIRYERDGDTVLIKDV